MVVFVKKKKLNHPSLKTNLKAYTANVYFETQGTNLIFFLNLSSKKILNGTNNLYICVVLCILSPETILLGYNFPKIVPLLIYT